MPKPHTKSALFERYAGEMLKSPDVRKMDNYIQHADVTCLKHCISVAYTSCIISEKFHIHVDGKSLVRGAMLHDFFLYDWHCKDGRKGLHGFTHPKTALINAQKCFKLNSREKDIILKHMWPLTPVPPKYRESYIVSAADKICSVIETLKLGTVYNCKSIK